MRYPGGGALAAPDSATLSWRVLVAAAVLAALASACSVDAGSVATRLGGDLAARGDVGAEIAVAVDQLRAELPAIGPAPGSSHWHAAYVVRVCDQVLEPFTDDSDPLGIHSHGDGLIHVHPFDERAGFERATLSRFATAVGLGLETGELTLPGAGTWRDGDLCDGVPGRVFVDRWQGPTPDSPVTRIFVEPGEVAFRADAELYQIAFAPADSAPVVPPSWTSLGQVSNLNLDPVEPWVSVDPEAMSSSVRFFAVAEVLSGPCRVGQVPERVSRGEPACFEPAADEFDRVEVVDAARAVTFNRHPAVELAITAQFRSFIVDSFVDDPGLADRGLVLAVEVDGEVVIAPRLARPSASEDRLVLSGGMTVATALDLAALLDG